jgi:hypothetical protein
MNGLRKCGIYTQWRFYLVMKKNEILSFTGKWMELEIIILSKVSQAQKIKNRMFSLMRTLDVGQIKQCGWTWVT